MQHAVDLMLRTTRQVASDIPLGLETAYRVQRHLHVPVDPMEIIQVSDTAVPDLVNALEQAGYTNPRQLLRHVWRHGAWAGLVAAPRRYKLLAKSGIPVAFRTGNATYATAHDATASAAVLTVADITARLAVSLKLARLQRDISQEDLAAQLRNTRYGVRPRRNEIIRWEKAKVHMREEALLACIAVLGHDISWWYEDHSDELAEFESRLVIA